jgi:hypothetical protein
MCVVEEKCCLASPCCLLFITKLYLSQSYNCVPHLEQLEGSVSILFRPLSLFLSRADISHAPLLRPCKNFPQATAAPTRAEQHGLEPDFRTSYLISASKRPVFLENLTQPRYSSPFTETRGSLPHSLELTIF